MTDMPFDYDPLDAALCDQCDWAVAAVVDRSEAIFLIVGAFYLSIVLSLAFL